MLFSTRSRLPKTIKFDYKPRYYDPDKEKKQARMRELTAAKNGDTEGIKNRISRRMQSKRKVQLMRSRQTFRSNMILVGVLVALVLLSGIFMDQIIEPMIQAFFNN